MCVIIVREPNIEIPFDKLSAACKVNGDGFGLSVMDRGKIETIKVFDPKGNDPDIVMRQLEQAKDQNVALHLRFRTAGIKQLDSCHPFETFTKKDHDFEISFMHNGTLTEFTKNGDPLPDSHHFNQEVIRPTLERFAAGMANEDLLKDPTLPLILKAFAQSRSKFVLYDQNGEILIINKDLGKEFDGWWASNDYSFNFNHRETYSGNGYGPHSNVHSPAVWAAANRSGSNSQTGHPYSGSNILPAVGGTGSGTASGSAGTGVKRNDAPFSYDTKTEEGEKVAAVIRHNSRTPDQLTITAPKLRETFTDLTGLANLNMAAYLEDEDVTEMIDMFPEVAATLIMDLVYELYIRDSARSTQAVG